MTQVIPFGGPVPGHTVRPCVDKAPAAPFIKRAGGRRSLIPSLPPHVPEPVGTCRESFARGGAVFFTMADRIDRAVLSDTDEELVVTCQTVKDDVDSLVDALRAHASRHDDEGCYHQIRAMEPACPVEIQDLLQRPLSREQGGQVQCAEGPADEGLRAASAVLAKAAVRIGAFDRVVEPGADDFICCEPPCDDCLTAYRPAGSDATGQERLRNAIDVRVLPG